MSKPWWGIAPSEIEPPDPPIACDVCQDLGTVDGEPCYDCPHCPICGKLLAVHLKPCREPE